MISGAPPLPGVGGNSADVEAITGLRYRDADLAGILFVQVNA
jgi:hypothetical protein